jgi:hypothetical protein
MELIHSHCHWRGPTDGEGLFIVCTCAIYLLIYVVDLCNAFSKYYDLNLNGWGVQSMELSMLQLC